MTGTTLTAEQEARVARIKALTDAERENVLFLLAASDGPRVDVMLSAVSAPAHCPPASATATARSSWRLHLRNRAGRLATAPTSAGAAASRALLGARTSRTPSALNLPRKAEP